MEWSQVLAIVLPVMFTVLNFKNDYTDLKLFKLEKTLIHIFTGA